MENKEIDVVILGAGPAGLSAAIYSARYGLRTVIIGKEVGGMANLAHKIENYPGFMGSGKELMKRFHKQAKNHGAEFLNEDIIGIKKEKNEFAITSNTRKLNSKAVIIALGSEKRRLNISGEDKFLGKGVSYCATCDAMFFKNKSVAVIGGGDSACKAALLLAGIAKKVYIIIRGSKGKCHDIEIKRLSEKKNVTFIYNSTPMEIKGKEVVEELVIKTEGKKLPREEKLKLNGVFIEVGSLPISDIARMLGIQLDENNFIVADFEMRTNVPGVFVAGDIVKSKLKQVILAAAQGALAAKSAYDYVKNSEEKNS